MFGGFGGFGGFGPINFNAGYPSGHFKGFTIDVDAISEGSLGGDWQSISLGGMSMQTNELPAGGYRRTTFREIERIAYGEVSFSRPWNAGTSSRITEWFSWANKYGPTTVSVTIEVPDQGNLLGAMFSLLRSLISPALPLPDVKGKKFNIIFRDCWPKDWQAPSFTAGMVSGATGGAVPATTIESLSFSFSGYKVEALGGAKPLIDTSIANEENVKPCKLVIIPNTSGPIRKMLANASSWTANQGGLGGMLGIGAMKNAAALQIATMAASYDSVEFYLPPAAIKVSKGATWVRARSVKAKGAGPVSFRGTKPMSMQFQFLMKTNNKDPFSAGGLMGGLQSGGGLFGMAAGALGMGSALGIGNAGFGKPRSVMDDLKKLVSLCENYSTGMFSTAKTPPLVMLLWGSFASPLMYITDLSADIVRFDADGTPSKAIGSMTLQQYPSSASGTNPTSGGLNPAMAETVLQGDTLAHLAYRSYQQPMSWRDIAETNGIDDPLRVRPGRRVLLPAPDELPARTHGGGLVVEEDEDFGEEGE